MPPEHSDIDINRRNFIKASLMIVGAFALGKVSEMLVVPSHIVSTISGAKEYTKEYTNAEYGFSFRYPSYLTATIFDEGEGATTLTFQNIEKVEGFQVYVAPHSGALPVDTGPARPMVIGGTSASACYGTHTDLGDTHEVRVAHGGFLYEVTTLSPLDTWLRGITETWKFA